MFNFLPVVNVLTLSDKINVFGAKKIKQFYQSIIYL